MTRITRLQAVSLLAQVFGIATIILLGIWLQKYYGGFAWDGSAQQFNVHPLCMVLGLVVLYGEALLVYRNFPNTKKLIVKAAHAQLLLISLVFAAVGLAAVFQFHNHQNIPNLYSIHSWCGIATLVLFLLQWICGFLCFVLPIVSPEFKVLYLGVHRIWGGFILALAGVTCISGINEKLIFGKNYNTHPAVGIIGNCCGLMIISFIIAVLFVIRKRSWKRVDIDESFYSQEDLAEY